MGILNVTPDSFSDGGRHCDPVAAAFAMMEEGADLIDIGGESTRPGATVIPVETEMARVLPVIAALARQGVAVSIDTRNAATMHAALESGARIINDVSALAHDPAAAAVVARAGCPVVLMHMRGNPGSMMGLGQYADVAAEVAAELSARIAHACACGISLAQIAIDPGIGFAKAPTASVALLQRLETLMALDLPMVVGVSRKGFIGTLTGQKNAADRAAGSIGAALWAVGKGASVLRVHDIAATVQAVQVWRGLGAIW